MRNHVLTLAAIVALSLLAVAPASADVADATVEPLAEAPLTAVEATQPQAAIDLGHGAGCLTPQDAEIGALIQVASVTAQGWPCNPTPAAQFECTTPEEQSCWCSCYAATGRSVICVSQCC